MGGGYGGKGSYPPVASHLYPEFLLLQDLVLPPLGLVSSYMADPGPTLVLSGGEGVYAGRARSSW